MGNEINEPVIRTPIEQFALDYDMPLRLATRLIGHTERETEELMDEFVRYLGRVINEIKGRMR